MSLFGEPFTAKCLKSGITVEVAEGQSLLQALLDAGISMDYSCEGGVCGTCVVPLVSGDPASIERVQPVLDAVGAKTVVAGDRLGDASGLKLACNAWILSITAATAQSVALAQALGVDAKLFLQAIEGGASDTPYAQLKGGAMIDGDFSPAFELDGGRKDLALIVGAFHDSGVDPAVIEAVKRLFDTASERGHGDDDLAAVYTALR